MMRMHGVLIGATLLAGLIGGTGASLAADDGYQDVFSSLATAVGLMKPDASPEIDYRERAPLVLPPRMELGKPAPSIAHPAAWPQDPDVLRRRKAAEEARAPSENLLGNPNNLLSKEEIMKGRTAGNSASGENAERLNQCGSQGNKRGCLVLSPGQLDADHQNFLASGGDASTKKELVAGQEPERMYLTQPPKGYMKATKTVKATTEAPKTYVDESNPSSQLVYRRKEDE